MGAQAAALQLAGCWGEAAGATGRPEGRLSSAGARGAGPRTEEEATLSLSGPGPGARPEGSQPDVPGPECPQRRGRFSVKLMELKFLRGSFSGLVPNFIYYFVSVL